MSPAGLDLLFLTQTYPRFPGDGSGPFIRDLAHGLARGGDRVTVLVPHAAGMQGQGADTDDTAAADRDPQASEVRVVPFRYAPESWEVLGYGRSLEADERVKGRAGLVAPLYALAARRAVARVLARGRFDLVHAHWLVPNAVAVAPLRRRPREAAPVFAAGLHGSDVFLAERPGMRRAAAFALGRAGLLTGCSPELVERVLALAERAGRPFPRERAAVIPYGVDPAAFAPGREHGQEWRRKLGVPQDAPLILGVGRMATKKGFHVLMRALPELLAANREAHLVLAGGGDRLEELRAAAASWPGRVHLPGAVRHDELPDLYRAADLFVMPAVHDAKGNVDGLPNVVLEAMASGLPVVASGISGIPLAVATEKTGLLVPEGDAGALAVALSRLLANPAEARAMGGRGRRRAETELSWDAVAAHYREAYRRALGAGAAL